MACDVPTNRNDHGFPAYTSSVNHQLDLSSPSFESFLLRHENNSSSTSPPTTLPQQYLPGVSMSTNPPLANLAQSHPPSYASHSHTFSPHPQSSTQPQFQYFQPVYQHNVNGVPFTYMHPQHSTYVQQQVPVSAPVPTYWEQSLKRSSNSEGDVHQRSPPIPPEEQKVKIEPGAFVEPALKELTRVISQLDPSLRQGIHDTLQRLAHEAATPNSPWLSPDLCVRPMNDERASHRSLLERTLSYNLIRMMMIDETNPSTSVNISGRDMPLLFNIPPPLDSVGNSFGLPPTSFPGSPPFVGTPFSASSPFGGSPPLKSSGSLQQVTVNGTPLMLVPGNSEQLSVHILQNLPQGVQDQMTGNSSVYLYSPNTPIMNVGQPNNHNTNTHNTNNTINGTPKSPQKMTTVNPPVSMPTSPIIESRKRDWSFFEMQSRPTTITPQQLNNIMQNK